MSNNLRPVEACGHEIYNYKNYRYAPQKVTLRHWDFRYQHRGQRGIATVLSVIFFAFWTQVNSQCIRSFKPPTFHGVVTKADPVCVRVCRFHTQV